MHKPSIYLGHRSNWLTRTQLATAFPFIFSLIVGRALRQLAAWKLERSISLRSLEQLMGSQTLPSAVATQFWVHCLDTLALTLLCLWSLSPIGIQSTLQLLSTREYAYNGYGNDGFFYFNTTNSPPANPTSNPDPYYHFLLDSLFLAPLTVSMTSELYETELYDIDTFVILEYLISPDLVQSVKI